MKHWPYILILVILFGAGAYYYLEDGTGRLPHLWVHASERPDADALASAAIPANIGWHMVDRLKDGFKVDMPANFNGTTVPAYTENGTTEPVNMLYANPDGDTTFAVTWQDNPPVAQENGNLPDTTLDRARDGMLAHTNTTLMQETRITDAGYPGREILAQNASGGILNVRMIYVQTAGGKNRLYTLMALFPTAGARRQQDVSRFFNSFVPENVPTAAATKG